MIASGNKEDSGSASPRSELLVSDRKGEPVLCLTSTSLALLCRVSCGFPSLSCSAGIPPPSSRLTGLPSAAHHHEGNKVQQVQLLFEDTKLEFWLFDLGLRAALG